MAEEKKQQQYEDMKLRIKYMYEGTSALERIVASGSISEMLTQTEYVEKVHTYDRQKLQEYAETVREVEDLKTSLEADMTNCRIWMKSTRHRQQKCQMIESKRAEVSNLDAMIQEAARAAVEAAKKEQEKNNSNNNTNNSNTNTPSGSGNQDTGNTGNSGGTPAPAPTPTPPSTPT